MKGQKQVDKPGNIKIKTLLTEYVPTPLGLDKTSPRFSWKLNSSIRGNKQSAYRILVSSDKDSIKKDIGDMWDSGRVESGINTNIKYTGDKLCSKKRYFWKVKVWDGSKHESSYSNISEFEMGLLKDSDWKARWITWKGDSSGIFRKEFKCGRKVKRARTYITGLGWYELRINGKKVGDRVLDPAQTEYDRTVHYATYDITSLLERGTNTIGAMLGKGRFSLNESEMEQKTLRFKSYAKSPIVLVQVEIEFEDGANITICTDKTWKAASGPIIFDDIYDGETYDAKLDSSGWDMPGFNDNGWDMVNIVRAPKGQMVSSADFPPITIREIIKPKKIMSPKKGTYVIDFGQNFSGFIKIKAKGAKGKKLTIRYSEVLKEDGTLNLLINRGARATDIYIFKGRGFEYYQPRFTYHGFRFAQIEGLSYKPRFDDISGVFINSSVKTTGYFKCSNPLINKILKITTWSILSNMHSILTDCPQRDERLGWLGDAQLTSESAILNYDMVNFFVKYMKDIGDSQKEDGAVPDVAPAYYFDSYPADPTWGSAVATIPWNLYLYYGDRKILADSFSLIKKWLNYLRKTSRGNIVEGRYGDWCPPGSIFSKDTHPDLVATWYYYNDTIILSKIAGVLGKDRDCKNYRRKALKIKESFNKAFFKDLFYVKDYTESILSGIPLELSEKEKKELALNRVKHWGIGCQTSTSLALYHEMVPKKSIKPVLDILLKDIEALHGGHINTGIVGTRYLFEVLARYGYAELAYKIVTKKSFPGWGYMIREGATTLWERWEYLDGSSMNSHNHHMLGSVISFFYRIIAGINIDEENPGFKNILIKPHPVGELKYASAKIDTMEGEVSSAWEKEDDSFKITVTIPVGSTAIVSLPHKELKNITIKEGRDIVWQDGKLIGSKDGITGANYNKGCTYFKIGSGAYCFKLTGNVEVK